MSNGKALKPPKPIVTIFKPHPPVPSPMGLVNLHKSLKPSRPIPKPPKPPLWAKGGKPGWRWSDSQDK